MLILLDIDGVMVVANSWQKPEFMADGFPAFNAKAVKALQRILKETNASVMLTTSHKSKYKVAELKGLLKTRGINAQKVQKLRSNSLKKTRAEEILDWYKKNDQKNEGFVIIDDDKMLNNLPERIKQNLILTSSFVGLTDDLANEAISILKKD